jgi:hypothetical protein
MATPPLPPSIPAHVVDTVTMTWPVPNILQTASGNSGLDVLTVRSGGNVQTPVSVETWFSETPVAPPAIFKILAQNQVKFAGVSIPVVNDAVTYNGKTLTPSNPTAAQYLAQVGQKVFTAFSCEPISPDSQVFKTYQRTALYAVKQTSIILP